MEEQKRFSAMLQSKGVNFTIDLNDLRANPFPHVGKTIAYCLIFSEMLTETQGLFSHVVVVSDVPRGMFTRSGTQVGLIGRILGRTELKGLTGTLAHLKFVDTYAHPKWCPGK